MAEPRVLVLGDSFIRRFRLFLSRDSHPILALISSNLTVSIGTESVAVWFPKRYILT